MQLKLNLWKVTFKYFLIKKFILQQKYSYYNTLIKGSSNLKWKFSNERETISWGYPLYVINIKYYNKNIHHLRDEFQFWELASVPIG